LVRAVAAEHERRRNRPAPTARFDTVLEAMSARVREDFIALCGLIREAFEEEISDADREASDRAAEDVCNVAWHLTRLLPNLDTAGDPEVDEKNFLRARQLSFDKHFESRTGDDTWGGLRNAAARLPVALGMVTAERMTKERFKAEKYGFTAETRRHFANRYWAASRHCASAALETLEHANARGELEPIYVVLRVVRVKLREDQRSALARRGTIRRGADYLTLETVIACRTCDDRLMAIRVMDDIWDWKRGDSVEHDIDRIAARAGECLRRVEAALPDMPRIAVFDETLPLGMPEKQSDTSFFREPAADADRADETRNPGDLLLDGENRRDAIGLDVLERWTVVARHDDLSPAVRDTIDDLDDPASGSRLVHFPPEPTDDADIDLRFYVASVPRAGGADYERIVEFDLPDDAYPRRSAGHRVMFHQNNDADKVDAAMQILLAYVACEEIELALKHPDGLPRPLDGSWWTLFKPAGSRAP